MSLKKNTEKVIGKLWFISGNFENLWNGKRLPHRAESIQDLIRTLADYKQKREKLAFTRRLVLDNIVGSIEHYLLSFDLFSIHLSSGAMEVAFLYQIMRPSDEEIRILRSKRMSIRSFRSIREIVILRGLLRTEEALKASDRVIRRRDMCVHDAILAQVAQLAYGEYLDKHLQKVNKSLAIILTLPFRKTIEQRRNLPDLTWYVRKDNFDYISQTMIDYVESQVSDLSKDNLSISSVLDVRRKLMDMAETEPNYLGPAARENLKDVWLILEEVFKEPPFK